MIAYRIQDKEGWGPCRSDKHPDLSETAFWIRIEPANHLYPIEPHHFCALTEEGFRRTVDENLLLLLKDHFVILILDIWVSHYVDRYQVTYSHQSQATCVAVINIADLL